MEDNIESICISRKFNRRAEIFKQTRKKISLSFLSGVLVTRNSFEGLGLFEVAPNQGNSEAGASWCQDNFRNFAMQEPKLF